MKKKYHIILILILSLWGAVLFSAAEAQLPISQTPSVTDIASASADQSAKTVTGQLTPDPEDFTTLINPFAAKLPKKIPLQAIPEVQPSPFEPRVPLPSAPLKEEEPQAPSFKIFGIVWNTDRPQAIINNQVVSMGDKIENSEIVAINKIGIDVVSEGQKFSIPY